LSISKFLACAALLAVAVVPVGCGDDEADSPTSPSGFATVPADAILTAPTPDSPADAAQLETQRPTLTVGNGTSNVPGTLPKVYEFQVSDDPAFTASSAPVSGARKVLVTGTGIAEGTGGRTSFTPTADLPAAPTYYWRSRFTQVGQASPWSAVRSFRTRQLGYIRPGELFDPLTDGVTVGTIHGSATFIPGVGIQLNDFTSYVAYDLPEPIVEGEFSAIVTNVVFNTEGGKTKVISMQEGTGDITTNRCRMTFEKRGDPAGVVAWRFIPCDLDDEIDTEGAERIPVNFDPSRNYLWKTEWRGNFFNASILDGGSSGTPIYSFGKPYLGTYRPNPHRAYLGSPQGRGGPLDQTVPGIILRNVWISRNPRPANLN